MYGALVAAIVSATPGPATTMTIVRVVGTEDGAADVHLAANSGAQRAMSWFVDVDPVDAPSPSVLRHVRRCGPDNRCVAARLAQAGVDRGVYVVANVSVRPYLVTVEILDAPRGRVIARTLVDPDARTVATGVERAVRNALLDAGHRLGGQLRVRAIPPDADLVVAGGPALTTADPSALLPPGTYRVEAERDGFDPASVQAVVRPERTTTVALELEPTSIWSSWWLWTGVSVVVVASVAAAVVVSTGSDRATVCHPVGGPPC